jgi:hypothetical protein
MAFTVDGKRINRVRQLIEDAKEMRLELQRPIVLATMAVRHSWLDGIADADAAALVGEKGMHERWGTRGVSLYCFAEGTGRHHA